jgi:excisionase family DNA binding protein
MTGGLVMDRLGHQAPEPSGIPGYGTPPRLLLTVEEAADRIGICRSSMFNLIRQGAVKSVKVGRLRRITPAALEDFIQKLDSSADSAA